LRILRNTKEYLRNTKGEEVVVEEEEQERKEA